jgi:DNA modification methylase
MDYPEIPISKLKLHPKNPRDHSPGQIQKIAISIKELGWGRPIIISIDNYILAGHGAYLAAKDILKLKKVPYRTMQHLHDSPEALAYMVADNKLTDESDWNYGKLKPLCQELKIEGFDTTLTGFEQKEIQTFPSLINEIKEVQEDDFDVDSVKESIVQPGQIYQLGNHRLMCGDSIKQEDVEQLMNGNKADMVFTDPPYNVDYGATKNPQGWGKERRQIKNDKMSDADWKEFNQKLIDILKEICTGDMYIWGAPGPAGIIQRLIFIENGIHWSSTIIWFKDHFVFGRANYQRIYEPCFYGWVNKSSFIADRKQVEVWEVNKPKNSKLHPTMKPIELCAYAIQNSSISNQIVLDLFGGSGSTLIACEQTDRKCYMMELDSHYCDVIIKRWEEFTEQKAVLLT